MESLRIFIKNMSREAKIVAGGVLAGFLVIIIIAIVVLNRTTVKDVALTEVTNFDEASNMPVGYKNVVNKRIGELINENDDSSDLVFSEATIRNGTYKEDVGDSTTKARFIVDIPELKYSFQVEVVWASKTDKNKEKIEDPDVTILCPHYLDVIYTDKKCIAQDPDQQLKRYLPYYEDLESGQRFGVSMKKFGGEYYVAVEVKSCGDNSIANSAVNATKQWMKSIYLDPNDYVINALDICKR